MRPEEGLPRRSLASLGRRDNALRVQDSLDRGATKVEAQTPDDVANAGVAMGRILCSDPSDKRGYVLLGAGAADTPVLAAVVFLGDELPIPAKDCVRGYERADFAQDLAAEGLSLHGQSPALLVGEPKPFVSVQFAKDPILLLEVLDHGVFVVVDPASEQ
jgi:hypothetical protein